jgi:hypothetical protein
MLKDLSTCFSFTFYLHSIVNLGTVIQFCNLVLLLRSRLQVLTKDLV